MTKPTVAFALGLLSLTFIVSADLQTCGTAQYDPTQYVCWNGNLLCPIIAGEGLSYCSGACYSTFMYSCTANALALLPEVPPGTPYTLTVANPQLPALDGQPVTACGLKWSLGGATCAYCPDVVQPNCPPGTATAMVAPGAMDVEVPGGQRFFLDPFGSVAYTQAHSAQIPPGSTVGGITAYRGGGLVNLNSGGWGWAACPPRASGGGGPAWSLVARNESNAAALSQCSLVNLRVHELPQGTVAAWQYT